MKCVYNYCVQSCVFCLFLSIHLQAINVIPIYQLIGIDNRYQSITIQNFAINWSSIININRLIDIDWYRLISIVIDYRFYRLDTPGLQTQLATAVYGAPFVKKLFSSILSFFFVIY